jgi:hypothetical protein
MKEEDEKEQRGFKVQDRRRFSSEGDTKAEVDEAPAPSAAAANANVGAESGQQSSKEAAAAGAHQHPSQAAGPELEITFATFLVGLSSEALGALGELPDPATGQARRDLQAAQQLIDIIGMLRDKTRGNLDQTEQSLIDAVLFDLRMKYVELARQSAR